MKNPKAAAVRTPPPLPEQIITVPGQFAVLIPIRLPPQRLFDPNQYLTADIRSNRNFLLGRPVMSTYHVSFFKNLLSSDGHPFKCLQRRIDVSDAESDAQAAESAAKISD
jgi:hypothetical protein